MELVLYNKGAFCYGKGILRRLVLNLFPEGGIMVVFLRCDAGYSGLFIGPGRICNPHI